MIVRCVREPYCVFLTSIGVDDDNHQDAKMEILADKGSGRAVYTV